MSWLPREDLLTYEEHFRVARLCVEHFGFDGIRITGGEPLVRAHVPRLIEMLAPLGVDLAMTTNGTKLSGLAHDLALAGLGRVNISLDSLRRDVFERLTRRDALDLVLAGIDAALDAGLDPVKVNCVVMRGINDDEIVDLAAFGRSKGVGMRFIEFMPLDADAAWSQDRVVPAAEILDRINTVFPLVREQGGSGNRDDDLHGGGHVAPAERFTYADGVGDVGVIASVTEPFCGDCDRVRVTAEGGFRTCLFGLDEFDLRGPMRGGASDAELAAILEGAVAKKWSGHRIGRVDFVKPPRSMSQIGG